MKIGFIGTGNMGSILVETLIRSGSVAAGQILIRNRTPTKAAALAEKHPDIAIAGSNEELVRNSRLVFLCVKPSQYKEVIEEIRWAAQEEQIVVSITSPVMIAQLESLLPCKISKMIPSITNAALGGVALFCHGSRMTEKDKKWLERLISPIASPVVISEQHTRVCSDISSCGPAFIAFIIRSFAQAAAEETGLPYADAERFACEMVYGTGKLLVSGHFTPAELQQKVTVPGGITAAGLEVLATELHGVFHRLIRATHRKFDEDVEKVRSMFSGG